LQYELEILDNLILDELNLETLNYKASTEQLNNWISVSQSQKQTVQKKIICTVFALNSEKKARIYIQNHQLRISTLINNITICLSDSKTEKNTKLFQAITSIRDNLIEILDFISMQYRNYFDFNAETTIEFRQRSAALFQKRIEGIFQKDISKYSSLIDIALKPVFEFVKNETSDIVSYQTINYYDILLSEIEKVCFNPVPLGKCLKFSMICINYNSFRFFAYLTKEIKSDLNYAKTHGTQIELLSKYLKKYNQIHDYSDLALHPKQKSIKEQISVWIIEEIELREKIHCSCPIEVPKLNFSKDSDFKFLTEMSVAQLGYFLKIAFEVGVIKNPNQRDVINFIANHTKTKQTDTISQESLRTRFYNIEDSTREAVKDYIIKMLNYVNKKT
jgi:hypothetical protein